MQNTTSLTTENMKQRSSSQAKATLALTGESRSFQDPSSVELTRRTRKKHKVKQPKAWKKILGSAFLVFLIASVSVGGWLGYKFIHNIDKVFGGSPFSNLEAFFGISKVRGETQGRVNILLAGDSADDPGHQGAQLTDSIMVLSIDTRNHKAFMLSIPRDLWVNIPGQGYEKINAANEVSGFSSPGLPSGGMGQLQQVVQTDLGIPIDYYALIDYSAFRDAVDAVGGINVTINSPDPRGLYDSYTNLKLSNGAQTLDGQTALNLARARCDAGAGDVCYGFPSSDFTRTQYQRQMLLALEQKASSVGVLSNPLKIANLSDAIGNNVLTNLTLSNVLRIDQLTKGINSNDIYSTTYQYGGTSPLLVGEYVYGQDALVPAAGLDNFSQLQNYYNQLTAEY